VGLAWAHFDVEVVTDIQDQLKEDPKAPLQAIRRDQAALLHFLRQASFSKREHRQQKCISTARIDCSEPMLDDNSFVTIGKITSTGGYLNGTCAVLPIPMPDGSSLATCGNPRGYENV
jgi:hypothetical protein